MHTTANLEKVSAHLVAIKTVLLPQQCKAIAMMSLGFWHMTEQATTVLKEELNKYAFNETGYLIFCHYQYVATDYMLIAMINIKEHYSMTSELDLASSRHLDISTHAT